MGMYMYACMHPSWHACMHASIMACMHAAYVVVSNMAKTLSSKVYPEGSFRDFCGVVSTGQNRVQQGIEVTPKLFNFGAYVLQFPGAPNSPKQVLIIYFGAQRGIVDILGALEVPVMVMLVMHRSTTGITRISIAELIKMPLDSGYTP